MAEMVGSAVIQEAVSRISSFVFGKHEDKAHEEHRIERLEIALSELEFALERSAKAPITDVSLLRRRQVFKHAYVEGTNLLSKHEGRKLQEGQDIGHVTRARNLPISSLIGLNKDKSLHLSCSQVRRFEWFADCARKFIGDVESGCSLRHYTFCNPLVRYLLEGKTLEYEIVQGSQLRCCHICPVISEDRGVEELAYRYDDRKMPYNSFQLQLMLRLSESTDIAGIAIKCSQSLSTQLVTKFAIGELTLLHGSPRVSKSRRYAPPRVGIQDSHSQDTVFYRPDPVCCKSSRQEPCASNITSSELSHTFPEQVIFITFQCSVSRQEYSLCPTSSSDEESGKMSPEIGNNISS